MAVPSQPAAPHATPQPVETERVAFGRIPCDVGYRRHAHGFHGRWRCAECHQVGISQAAYSSPVAAVAWAMAAADAHCDAKH